MTAFTVSYERKFSDRNYGSEGISASWTWEPEDDGETPSESLSSAIETLRHLVLGELLRSASEAVSWAADRELHPPSKQATRIPVTVSPDSGDDKGEDLPF